MHTTHQLTALLICCNEKNMSFAYEQKSYLMRFETKTSVLRYCTANNRLYHTIIWVDVLQQSEVDLQPLASKLMNSMNNLNECSFRCLHCVKQTT